MEIQNLKALEGGGEIETDLLIIGGGAAGLSIAYEFFGETTRVLIAESGDRVQTDEHERLNEVDFDATNTPATWRSRRNEYHGHQASKWSGDVQKFGVRCRGLGGSTAAWAGKCAPFPGHDLVTRDWLPVSGWPFDAAVIEPFVRRAERRLNIGSGPYDDTFWAQYTGRGQSPGFDTDVFSSFFWQFARSRSNPVDMLRMGSDFAKESPSNVRILINSTAREILPIGNDGWARARFTGFEAPETSV
ncbi:MAG: GMC family oxidoreductase, partial [Pseudomonadota bacterium]